MSCTPDTLIRAVHATDATITIGRRLRATTGIRTVGARQASSTITVTTDSRRAVFMVTTGTADGITTVAGVTVSGSTSNSIDFARHGKHDAQFRPRIVCRTDANAFGERVNQKQSAAAVVERIGQLRKNIA